MPDPTPESTHDLLLALAGRVDDDLLAWARELVAVGEDGQAVDLLTATLIADRVALPAAVRAALVDAGRLSRAGLAADRALPAAAPDGTGHRFAGDGPDARRLADALPADRLRGCRVRLAWRLTPAGAAPGPLPQPVVLVESDGSAVREVLAYQVAAALDRAGARAAVEVFDAGVVPGPYHASALDAAVTAPLEQSGSVGAGSERGIGSAARTDPVDDEADRRLPARSGGPADGGFAAPEGILPRAEEPTGADAPGRGRRRAADPDHAADGADSGGFRSRRRDAGPAGSGGPGFGGAAGGPAAGTDDPARTSSDGAFRSARRAPEPAAASSGGAPDDPSSRNTSRPAAATGGGSRAGGAGPDRPRRTEPATPPAGQRLVGPAAPPAGQRPPDGQDALSGPLRQPLLEPLLDPTIRPEDPLGLGTAPVADPAESGDWFTGSWAMPADPQAEQDTDRPLPRRRRAAEPGDRPEQPTPSPRPMRRNRYRPDDEAAPAGPDGPAPEPGPETLSALSDTERELLAQLQAELAAREGRPRTSRRAGIAGSPSSNGNGHTAGPPPRPRPDDTD